MALSTESVWTATSAATSYPALAGDLEVDVAVLGGGITGLTIASLLRDAGAEVAVIEARGVASGVTANTTGKFTALHTLTYAGLIRTIGEAPARVYAAANQEAVRRTAELAATLDVDCDITWDVASTYTEDSQRRGDIEDEVAALQRLGQPAELVTDLGLPYPIVAAVQLPEQLMLHARTYTLGLAARLIATGGRVFERTRALKIDGGDPCAVTTEHGVVRAGHVVIATLIPFDDRGAFFAREFVSRSYCISVRLNGPLPTGMHISVEEPTRSLRPHRSSQGEWLVVAGEGHVTGRADDTRERYDRLETWARERFPVAAVDHRWSAQDYMSADTVPFVGPLYPGQERMLVATGSRKWGLAHAMVAATILRDRVQGVEHPWADTYRTGRLRPRASLSDLVTENARAGAELAKGHVRRLRAGGPDDLEPGEGAVVEVDGRRCAAYRDDDGQLRAVSAICTHLGCVVNFNAAERSWDCPCHGSRFDLDGSVLNGPAVRGLEPVDLQ